jgi:transitional endoplasmic reticulum ATPase
MIQRKVVETYGDDEGRSICRLDPDSLLECGLSPGNIVRIAGESDAYAKVWRSDREDWNKNQIQIDEFIRYNSQSEIGDTVTVEKVTLDSINQIKLVPYRGDNIEFGMDAVKQIKKQKLKTPIQVGNVLAVSLSSSENPLPLVVTSHHTTDPGVITESTTIDIPESFLSDSDPQ